jgi:shikimate dehydrogenase
LSEPNRIRAGLIGRHIGASRSPWLHEREAHAQGLDLTYELFDFAVMGRDESDLRAQIDAAAEAGYAGLNITYPYKQAVFACLDDVAPSVAKVGAVNTVRLAAGKSVGHNTDVVGFAESMREGLPDAALDRVLQIGAGGGGAATALALLELGVAELLVCDQDVERATALVHRLHQSFDPARSAVVTDMEVIVSRVDGVVNATPMGMAANPRSPIDASRLMPRQWVADIVYFPLETEFLRIARARGCRTLDGSGMAVYQAAAAFEIFTGRRANRPRMRHSFTEYKPTDSAISAGLGALA